MFTIKARKVFYSVLAVAIMFIFVPKASAIGMEPVKEKTLDCPYGTITGTLSLEREDVGHGLTYYLQADTEIDSSYNMVEVETSIECQYADTGLPGSSTWSNNSVTKNGKSNTVFATLYNLEGGRDIRVYTAHQVVYTNAYVLYMDASV